EPTLSIPIRENVFKTEGEPNITNEGDITEKIDKRLPIDYKRVVLSAIGVIILAALLYFTKKAEVQPDPDEFQRQIDAIFKEYSERLAGLEHTISYQLSENITINNIEDMVKIADEVGQPVFYYKVDSSIERKIEFFVFDNIRTYYMVIFGELEPDIEE
ncbi:MAG: DUF5305 domain-containing protein, partial [Clostridiales bacterium]|nr:DUF5305 domain-containing protein [Clostridiales bacterium]